MKEHEFYRRAMGHDWFYTMSNDPDKYQDGARERSELNRLAKESGWEVILAQAKNYQMGKDPVPPSYRGFTLSTRQYADGRVDWIYVDESDQDNWGAAIGTIWRALDAIDAIRDREDEPQSHGEDRALSQAH